MNIDNLKQARDLISNEIDNSMKLELGTNQFSKLCLLKGDIDLLINYLEEPDKHKKLNKLANPDERKVFK